MSEPLASNKPDGALVEPKSPYKLEIVERLHRSSKHISTFIHLFGERHSRSAFFEATIPEPIEPYVCDLNCLEYGNQRSQWCVAHDFSVTNILSIFSALLDGLKDKSDLISVENSYSAQKLSLTLADMEATATLSDDGGDSFPRNCKKNCQLRRIEYPIMDSQVKLRELRFSLDSGL